MQIHIHTSNGIENKEALERWADGLIRQHLGRFTDEVTRVEAHLSDEKHDKAGEGDKCCVMEARLAHQPPLAVTHYGATLDEAFRGAGKKLKRMLESTVDSMTQHRDRETIRKVDGASPD